ncbi:hypothetical protein QBC39DRAFT_108191 [Podospora conica]|nr:hypothetical protein QBC39DRAFT_108191 [Schizothecium conicum]
MGGRIQRWGETRGQHPWEERAGLTEGRSRLENRPPGGGGGVEPPSPHNTNSSHHGSGESTTTPNEVPRKYRKTSTVVPVPQDSIQATQPPPGQRAHRHSCQRRRGRDQPTGEKKRCSRPQPSPRSQPARRQASRRGRSDRPTSPKRSRMPVPEDQRSLTEIECSISAKLNHTAKHINTDDTLHHQNRISPHRHNRHRITSPTSDTNMTGTTTQHIPKMEPTTTHDPSLLNSHSHSQLKSESRAKILEKGYGYKKSTTTTAGTTTHKSEQ